MTLEQQVCSLELAKKLKELGVRQGGWNSDGPLFYWSFYDGAASRKEPNLINAYEANFGFMEDLYSAFTVAELGEMLPVGIKVDGRMQLFRMTKGTVDERIGWTTWYLNHLSDRVDGIPPQGYRDTEADARAKMLVYLIENKLITLS